MSTVIADVKSKSMFLGNVNNTGKRKAAQEKETFSQIFDKTQNFEETPEKENSVKTEDSASIQNHANIQKNKSSESIKEQTEEVSAVKKEKDVENAVTESAEKMVEKIAETFDVTVEEVESVLETLGLTVLDLLNSENLTQVVLALNPECDALTLMTNENLFADLKGLMNAAQKLTSQITQEFHLSEDEMVQVLSTLKEQIGVQFLEENAVHETLQLSDVTKGTTEDTIVLSENVSMQEKELSETISIQEKELSETISMQEKEFSDVRGEEDKGKEIEFKERSTYDGTLIPKNEISQEVHSHSSAAGEENGNGNMAGQNAAQNFVNQLAEAVENTVGETTSYGVRGQDIINQITEHIRVYVKEDTTEMELQLHPASLGNVKVQLTSAGGVLTAVFTTENEAVKTALESQLIQLKENFTAQGLKVESVEVNVSAQGFERSLDQQEQEQRRFEDGRSKRGNRRLRLNAAEGSDDLLTSDMTADERIAADMMIRNGNTVDYTV